MNKKFTLIMSVMFFSQALFAGSPQCQNSLDETKMLEKACSAAVSLSQTMDLDLKNSQYLKYHVADYYYGKCLKTLIFNSDKEPVERVKLACNEFLFKGFNPGDFSVEIGAQLQNHCLSEGKRMSGAILFHKNNSNLQDSSESSLNTSK